MRSLSIRAPPTILPLVLAAYAAGIGALQTRAALPAMPLAGVAVAAIVAVAVARLAPRVAAGAARQWARAGGFALAAFVAGFGYAAWRADLRLSDALPPEWEGRDIALVGVIDDLPDASELGVRFALAVEQIETPDAWVPARLSLSWRPTHERGKEAGPGRDAASGRSDRSREPRRVAQRSRDSPGDDAFDDEDGGDVPTVSAGERWRFVVRLRRPHGYANPGGFDLEAWLLERNLRATGYVHASPANERLDAFAGRFSDYVQRARERVRERVAAALPDGRYAGVVAALAIGDQRAIPDAQWRMFNRTGVGHLVSISGLHVTALAALAAWVAARLARGSVSLTDRVPARSAGAIAGVAAAGAYTLLAGAEVPALRTFAMLATGSCALIALRQGGFGIVWLWALAAVLTLDPWAVLAPGFWLSYGAVAVLVYGGIGRVRAAGSDDWLRRIGRSLREGGRTQWAVTVGLAPFALALFGQVSMISPIANAIAIPLVSFLVVPLAVGGILVPGDLCFVAAHAILVPLMALLERLAEAPGAAWVQHAPAAWTLGAAAVGVAWLLAPRGVPGRALGVLWLAPLALVVPEPPPEGSARITVLDVGQGLAVVVRTRGHALVYDTGSRWHATADAGSRIVVPFLRHEGIDRLDALVVSHQDLDHAGGVASVLAGIPVGRIVSSLPADHPVLADRDARQDERCQAGLRWRWDDVDFEMLHPVPPYFEDPRIRTNDLSCVLVVSAGATRVLLPGDIEARSEARLLDTHRDELRADAIVAPHHGSRTSSTRAFVSAVAPSLAVFTMGYRNRFGHPRADVVARYAAVGASIARSDRDGAIAFDATPAGLSPIARRRHDHVRYWQDRALAEGR